jgi:DEAD/DEAH box helicase domain-containing protein
LRITYDIRHTIPIMNEIVLDLETKKSFQEVGGKNNMHLLGVSVVGVYHYVNDTFETYEEKDFSVLEEILRNTSRVIGFNSKHFDFPVLQPHVNINLQIIPHLDLIEATHKHLGFRVSLDNLAKTNLGVQKSGHGLDAITWWREGNMEAIKKYCLDDVRITRDVYEHGKKYGKVTAETRNDPRAEIPVAWDIPRDDLRKMQGSLF